jgi:CHAT domain
LTLATIFPKLLECIRSETDTSAWNTPVNLNTKASVQQALAVIDEAARLAGEHHTPDLLDIPAAIAADLASLVDGGTIPKPTLLLLRMVAASLAIDCAVHRKQFSVVRDWILYALMGRFEDANVVELDDISDPQRTILDSSAVTADFVRAPFLIWAFGLFYYVRVTGDLKYVAASYLTLVEQLCMAQFDELSIETLVYAGTWATLDGDSRGAPILRGLATLLENTPLPKSVSIQLAVALSAGAGQRAGLDTLKVAETALIKFEDGIDAFAKLQLLSHAYAGSIESISTHLADFENAIREYSAYVDSVAGDYISAAFEKERSFDIIAPIVGTLATSGRVADAILVVCLWRGASKSLSVPKVFILLPTWHRGVVFAGTNGMEIWSSADVSDSILRLTETGNNFFGTNVVLKDDDRFSANQASRPGIPDTSPQASDEFERTLCQHFQFARVVRLLDISASEGMLIIPQSREPIQSLMLKTIGRTLPISASCAPSKPDRPVRRVCVWWASTTYGEFEQRWVVEAFRRRNVEIVTPSTRSKEEFEDLYSSPELDVFWMIGHGRFDHYYPERMSVDLTETVDLTLSEWLKIELHPDTRRRLFVANLCDSGTTATVGGTGELGLPVVLAQPTQALIAHLWPVSAMHAAIFGAILATQLAKQQSFFAAYCAAAKIMISGRRNIEAELMDEFGAEHEIIQRFHGASDIWNQLFIWGSPTFLS